MPEPLPAVVEIAESVIFQTLEDEVILLDMTTQEYYGLNPVGANMWKLLMECGDVSVATGKITTMYAADAAAVHGDMQSLVADLLARGLLKAASGETASVAK